MSRPPSLPGPAVALTYAEVGATRGRDLGGELPAGYHHVRYQREIGRGEDAFSDAVDLAVGVRARRRDVERFEAMCTRRSERLSTRCRPAGLTSARPAR